MRFAEIGQQLRAYRMESGLRAEEIAARLGVSRAALYRYEKGEVIKLDTVKRLAELLKVSPLSLLGIGVEYYGRSAGFFERIRQIEENADQILQAFGPACYLTTSDAFDAALADGLGACAELAGDDRAAMRTAADQVLSLLKERKRNYQQRRPGIIAIVSEAAIRTFLEQGILGAALLPDELRARCREVAAGEMANIAELMDAEPMGLQFGLLRDGAITSGFSILRAGDRATLAVNPFRADGLPTAPTGVAMITGADEAVAAHQRVAEAMWRDSLKGKAGAARIRELLASRSTNTWRETSRAA
ncbi:MAG: helix-turn-helix domain-containing protein [Acetobacteraceae bacterium]|nr:helix-turn-helix domain-containing protein [Acetobacteraceae bacterium]